MWSYSDEIILLIEILLILLGVWGITKKKKGLLIFVAASVFMVNWIVYSIPWISELLMTGGGKSNIIVNMLDSFTNTVKQFVGEVRTDGVLEYAEESKLYPWELSLGLVLAFATSFVTAISVFSRNTRNNIRCSRKLRRGNCDIVVGCSEAALNYAKRHENTILLVGEETDSETARTLIDDGYTIIRKNLTVELFEEKYFRYFTTYRKFFKTLNKRSCNFIYPNESGAFTKEINTILSYIDLVIEEPEKKKNIRFYIELNETAKEVFQDQIDKKKKKENDKKSKWKSYNENITVFSRNELIARIFVEENPITAHMSPKFFEKDTSVKGDVKMNVFMLGFGGLSKEVYKQFVINNQLITLKDGEYRVLPINYYIYGENINKGEWNIDGLKDVLAELGKNQESYMPIPDMPYKTECFSESSFEFDCLRVMCDTIKKDSLSYIIIDTGDVIKNIDLSKKIKLLIGDCDNFRIFIYDDSPISISDEDIFCYGKLDEIYTHDVVVNESLIEFAKNINKQYMEENSDYEGEELAIKSEESWRNQTYFATYSNIYLANSIRLKLNLMGLDYVKDGAGKGIELITSIDYKDYREISKTNAFLAQEHYRWNAYHLLSGYLPMKKEKVRIQVDETGVSYRGKDEIMEKHICLTSFMGLAELSDYIADRANEIAGCKTYSGSDFSDKYYKNDGMLIEIAPKFFKEKGYSVFKRV